MILFMTWYWLSAGILWFLIPTPTARYNLGELLLSLLLGGFLLPIRIVGGFL